MGIQEKLAEIRSKPEGIRVRYLWGMVFVSMFFILLIWTISLKQKVGLMLGGEESEQSAASPEQSVENLVDKQNKLKSEIGSPEIKSN